MERKRYLISGFLLGAMFLMGGLLGWIGGSFMTPVERVNQTAQGGFVPGIGGGPEISDQVIPYTTTVSDFRVQLHGLIREHGIVASEYLQTLYDGKDAGALKSQLSQNTDLLSEIVGKMYGNDAKNTFSSHWNRHIAMYEEYTIALKENNQQRKNDAQNNLLNHSEMIGESLQKIDRNFSQARVTNLMQEHVRLTMEVIDAYAAKDSALLAANMKRAYDQAGEFADYIGQAIAASRPNILQ